MGEGEVQAVCPGWHRENYCPKQLLSSRQEYSRGERREVQEGELRILWQTNYQDKFVDTQKEMCSEEKVI